MSIRLSIQDFLRDIAGRTNASGTVVYVGSINADGSVKVTRNGVVLYPHVIWADKPATINDATGKGPAESITSLNADGTISTGDCQQWLQSLV